MTTTGPTMPSEPAPVEPALPEPTNEVVVTAAAEAPEASALEASAAEASAKRGGRRRFALAFAFGLLGVLAMSAGAMAAFDRSFDGRILPGVHVAGVDLSGLTAAQAADRLRTAADELRTGSLTIVADGGSSQQVSYAELNRRYDVDSLVAEALAVGRDGALVERVARNIRTAVGGIDIAPRVLIDGAVLSRAIDELAKAYRVDPVDATVTSGPDGFVVTPASTGRSADEAAAGAATQLLVDPNAPADTRITLRVAVLEPTVSTEEAAAARDRAEGMAKEFQLATGGDPVVIPAAEVRTWLTFSPSASGKLDVVIDEAALKAALGEVAPRFDVPPVDATFEFKDTAVVGVKGGTDGQALDVDATAALVQTLLDERSAGQDLATVTPALTAIKPTLSAADAQAVASKMQPISTWTTYFPYGDRNGFGANIWIPAADLDGKVIAPGAWFDFWKEIGPVTRERGYKDGGAIINGKTEPQGALAGGICSCSTTLFNAAVRAGLEMGARRNHYYYIDRYPMGLDATVFESSSGSVQTMSFRNDTDYPIIITSKRWRVGTKGYVRFDLWSVPTGRTVTFTKPIIKNVLPATDTVQYTDTLPYGTKQRVEYPVNGMDVWVTRTVKDASGKVIHEETYYSHYARITGLTLIGTAGAPAPSPSPTPTATP